MYRRAIIFVIIFSFFEIQLYSQTNSLKEYKLVVGLQDAPFSSLALRDYRDMHNVIIKGKLVSPFKWEFLLPDSIVENSEFMELFVPEKDTVVNAFRKVRLVREDANKKVIISNIGVQGRLNCIEGIYKKSNLFENENVASLLGNSDSTINGNLICDDFDLLIKKDSSDIVVRSVDAYFTWFDRGDSKLSYNDHLQSYIDLADKYPDSRYLITYLSLNLLKFKTRSDVKAVYQTLSNLHKSKKWAKRIERYILGNFEIPTLINLDTKNNEPLVQDSSKYTLLIFTASWCGPCIEEMPLLKTLYKDLEGRINFTNISMDYQRKTKAFQDILIKNSIPWRTLYAYQDLDKVTDLFSIKSIPLTLLVYPDGHIEALDVRELKNQKKLLSLL